MKREAHPRDGALRLSAARFVAGLCETGVAVALLVGPMSVSGQGPAPHAAAAAPSVGASAPTHGPAREEGIRWQALTPPQKEALAPLERDWPGIDGPRKQKWLALAARFKTLGPDERARITARMSEWAKLTPAERGQARMRFEEARQVPAPDRSARWQAYQALPAERKQQLAARAASAAAASGPRESAARGVSGKEAKFNVVPNPALTQRPRQVAPTLVQAGPGATTTPITRKPMPPAHQPTGMPKIAATPEFVNRSTLLPKRGPQAAAVVPASAVAPVTPIAVAPVAPTALPTRPVAASAPR